MSRVRVYQIPIENERKIVYIPEILKVYLVSNSVNIPTTINVSDYNPKPFNFPRQQFRRCDLILNNYCNLRCIYCYSNAGLSSRKEMSFKVARKAIDRVIDTCVDLCDSKFGITLTGGGEPLLSFGLVQKIVSYCRMRSKKIGINCKLSVVSNANFSSKICQYVINNFDNISISVDGRPELHDRHRPTIKRIGSFSLLAENVDRLRTSGKIDVGFRMTVSALNVENLSEHILFLHKRWPGVLIGIEPIEKTGRCGSIDSIAPDPLKFAKSFVRAVRIAKEYGIQIRSSIATLKALPEMISFCGVNGKIFGVDPEGNITACTRVNSRSDPLASLFHFGYYDEKKDEFVINHHVYDQLSKLVVDSIPKCQDCFAKYSCKGDCCHLRAGVYGKDFVTHESPKCVANRTLMLGLLRLELGLPDAD